MVRGFSQALDMCCGAKEPNSASKTMLSLPALEQRLERHVINSKGETLTERAGVVNGKRKARIAAQPLDRLRHIPPLILALIFPGLMNK